MTPSLRRSAAACAAVAVAVLAAVVGASPSGSSSSPKPAPERPPLELVDQTLAPHLDTAIAVHHASQAEWYRAVHAEVRRQEEAAAKAAAEEAALQAAAEEAARLEAAREEAARAAAPPAPPAPAVRSSYSGACGGMGDPNNMACWDRLAQCESGGNWAINTGNGYYGGIQFALSSWRGVGGSGYPHEHSRAEQIRRGQMLYAQGGWRHWPACTAEFGWR